MHACARLHQMLWSKDVLERFRPQLLQKRDNGIYWISLYPVDDVVGFPDTY